MMLAFAVFGTMLFANNTDPVKKISLEPQLSSPYSPDTALEVIEYSSEVPSAGPNWCYACATCNGVPLCVRYECGNPGNVGDILWALMCAWGCCQG